MSWGGVTWHEGIAGEHLWVGSPRSDLDGAVEVSCENVVVGVAEASGGGVHDIADGVLAGSEESIRL